LESVQGQEDIELSKSEADLYSQSSSDASSLPASLLFSIPLPADTPQSFETPYSSLKHILTATLHAADPSLSISRSLQVHTKRYSSHGLSIPIFPETHSSSDPTLVKVEVPRKQYTAGESVPIYVTVPPPAHALVEAGLRLRNVRAELVQSIRTNISDHAKTTTENSTEMLEGTSSHTLNPTLSSTSSSSKAPISPLVGPEHISIIARSGAQCRFSASRAVQLRFVLQQSSPDSTPVNYPVDLPGEGAGSHADSESISQETLLHSVSFSIQVHVSFVEPSSRTERVSTITIPISILPAPAPLPEVAPSMDIAYQKKHDQPPTRTVRQDDVDAPGYLEGAGAGPSVASGFGAPPPFEERDAPPSFFEASSSSYMEASSSSRLPTFQEAESEIIVPPPETSPPTGRAPQLDSSISGEGVHFGFTISEQYDGHSDSDLQRNTTPPPTLEMATMDTDVTQLAGMSEPERTIEAMGIALEQQHQQHQRSQSQEAPPPPPPAMDDPSDPPPSIDSDFRAPMIIHQPHAVNPSVRYSSPPPELPTGGAVATLSQEPAEGSTADHNAPPPYLVPESHQRHEEHASGPPPYVG